MRAYLLHLLFELRNGMRDRTLLLMNYLLPLGFFVLAGSLIVGLNPLFKASMIPAMVVFAILASMLLGLPAPLVAARDGGILRSLRVNGVPSWAIISIPGVTTAAHMVVVAGVIALGSVWFFDASAPAKWAGFAAAFGATAVAFSGLGALIGVISVNERASVLWSQLIFIPSMILGGLMIPLDAVPDNLAWIGMLLPTSYAMQAFTGLGHGAETMIDPYLSLSVLLVGGAAAFLLAGYLFAWDSSNRPARRPLFLGALALLPYLGATLLLRS